MSDDNQKIKELLEKLGIDPSAMSKAEEITAKYGTKPSKSKIMTREALTAMIMFVHENRATILPYTVESFAVLNEKKTESEMLTAYLNYMINDFMSGAEMMIEIAREKGFDRAVEVVERQSAELAETLKNEPVIEML